MHCPILAAAAALALAASGCAAPSAETSSAGGAAGRTAAKASPASPGSKSPEPKPSGAGGETAEGKALSWWQRLTRSGQEPAETPWVYGDVRPGGGLLSSDEDGFVLLRKGEGRSSDPTKPAKVRR